MDHESRRPHGPHKPAKKYGNPQGDHRAGPRRKPIEERWTQPRPPKTDWHDVAEWYDALVGTGGSEYQQKVVLPGVLELLGATPGQRVLDVACGQGVLCRQLHQLGVTPVGVDAAPGLIHLAKKRGEGAIAFHTGDARSLGDVRELVPSSFDAAACVLAIQNIDPFAPVFQGVSRLLKPGGRFVVAMMHPAFRVPKAADWGFDPVKKVQFRRVERYLTPTRAPIIMHPGKNPSQQTWTFHRSIADYINALASAGFAVNAMREWPSHKTSDNGPRAIAENVARREIPLFLALRAVKAT